jgi:hypothetical protein
MIGPRAGTQGLYLESGDEKQVCVVISEEAAKLSEELFEKLFAVK